MREFHTLDDLRGALGASLGASSWVEIDQDRIDTFADATGDHQWIHVDAERAADGPFGTTIAHGYLTLSLVPVLMAELVRYSGWDTLVNYGSNKVRFTSPVPVGSRVRLVAEVADVTEVRSGIQVQMAVTVEVEGTERPALRAETITLLVS